MRMNPRLVRRGMGWWPPFLGAGKVLPEFEVDVTDEAGAVVAKVCNTIYVRLKPRLRPA